MPSKRSKSAPAATPTPTPFFRRRRVRLALLVVPVVLVLGVATVLVLAPQWIFPPANNDTGPVTPPGTPVGPFGINPSLYFAYSPASRFSFDASHIQCPPQVQNTSIFTCDVDLVNTSPSTKTVSGATTPGPGPYQLKATSTPLPWQVGSENNTHIGLNFLIPSATVAGTYGLNVTLTVS